MGEYCDSLNRHNVAETCYKVISICNYSIVELLSSTDSETANCYKLIFKPNSVFYFGHTWVYMFIGNLAIKLL